MSEVEAHGNATMLTLNEVAAQLRVTTRQLKELSRRGTFPKVLRVSRKQWRVDRAEFEAWKAGAWKAGDALAPESQPAPTALPRPRRTRRQRRKGA